MDRADTAQHKETHETETNISRGNGRQRQAASPPHRRSRLLFSARSLVLHASFLVRCCVVLLVGCGCVPDCLLRLWREGGRRVRNEAAAVGSVRRGTGEARWAGRTTREGPVQRHDRRSDERHTPSSGLAAACASPLCAPSVCPAGSVSQLRLASLRLTRHSTSLSFVSRLYRCCLC